MIQHTQPPRSSRRGAARLAVIVIAVVVLAAVAALAVPKLLSGGSGEQAALPPALAPAQAPAAPAEPEPEAEPARAAAPAPTGAPVSEQGDLVLELALRFPRVESKTIVPATLRFVNTSLKAIHLPAPGETSPTLAIVVLDAEGNVVRRIVETGPDPFPRRTRLVASGAALELPVTIVGDSDESLPPGEYTVYAELKRNAAWSKLGIPMWAAPHGPVRSLQEPLTITAAAPLK